MEVFLEFTPKTILVREIWFGEKARRCVHCSWLIDPNFDRQLHDLFVEGKWVGITAPNNSSAKFIHTYFKYTANMRLHACVGDVICPYCGGEVGGGNRPTNPKSRYRLYYDWVTLNGRNEITRTSRAMNGQRFTMLYYRNS